VRRLATSDRVSLQEKEWGGGGQLGVRRRKFNMAVGGGGTKSRGEAGHGREPGAQSFSYMTGGGNLSEKRKSWGVGEKNEEGVEYARLDGGDGKKTRGPPSIKFIKMGIFKQI